MSPADAALEALADLVAEKVAQRLGSRVSAQDELVSLAEAGPPVRTLRKAIRSGELAAVKVGREYRVRRSDLAAWLEARAVQPCPVVHRAQPRTAAERAIARAQRAGTLRVVGGSR